MERNAAGIYTYSCLVFHKGHPDRVLRSILCKPFYMINLFQTFHYGFFHDRLDIRGTEKLALYRICLSYPEFSVDWDILFPGKGLGFFKKFIEGFCLNLSCFQENPLCSPEKNICSGYCTGIPQKGHLSIFYLADLISQVLNFSF